MKHRYLILIASINFIVQTMLAPFMRLGGIAPNTALILTVVTALLGGTSRGLAFGLTAGVLQDLFFSKALGMHTLTYGLIALGVGVLEHKLFKDNRLTPAILIIGATLIYYLSLNVMLYFANNANSFVFILLRRFPMEALYNTAVCLAFYRRLFAKVRGYGLS